MGSIPGLGRTPGGGLATHSSILAWRIPWTEEPGGRRSIRCKESDTTERQSTALSTFPNKCKIDPEESLFQTSFHLFFHIFPAGKFCLQMKSTEWIKKVIRKKEKRQRCSVWRWGSPGKPSALFVLLFTAPLSLTPQKSLLRGSLGQLLIKHSSVLLASLR